MNYKRLSVTQILEQCSVRVSSRAKFMRLTVSLDKGIEIVIPQAMSQVQAYKMIPGFVLKQQGWINTTLQRLSRQHHLKPRLADCHLPQAIELIALNKTFKLEYTGLIREKLILRMTDEKTLSLSGSLSRRYEIFQLLEQFLRRYAYDFIHNRLSRMSRQTGLTFNRLTIRAQKTRWGSCSSKKNINLNYRLLFVDRQLLDYILLHELAHTVHLNHSKDFWDLVEKFMPDYKTRDEQINRIRDTLPCWVFYKELL